MQAARACRLQPWRGAHNGGAARRPRAASWPAAGSRLLWQLRCTAVHSIFSLVGSALWPVPSAAVSAATGERRSRHVLASKPSKLRSHTSTERRRLSRPVSAVPATPSPTCCFGLSVGSDHLCSNPCMLSYLGRSRQACQAAAAQAPAAAVAPPCSAPPALLTGLLPLHPCSGTA